MCVCVDARGISHAALFSIMYSSLHPFTMKSPKLFGCTLPLLLLRTEPFDRESRHRGQHSLKAWIFFVPVVSLFSFRPWQVFLPGELEVKEQEARCKQENKNIIRSLWEFVVPQIHLKLNEDGSSIVKLIEMMFLIEIQLACFTLRTSFDTRSFAGCQDKTPQNF